MNGNTQPESYRVALFLHCVGPEALKIFSGMSFSNPSDREKVECIIAKFDKFTIGEVNETYERYLFNSRNQSPEESVDAYIAIIRTVTQTCNFCDCLRDSLIHDRIVLGVCNSQTRKRLFQERKLTLNKCIDICHSSESTASQLKVISGPKTTEDVHQIQWRPEKPRAQNNTRRKPKNAKNGTIDNSRKSCNFCDGDHSFIRGQCSAWDHICCQCGGRNHFQSKCKKRPKPVHNLAATDYASPLMEDFDGIDYYSSQ